MGHSSLVNFYRAQPEQYLRKIQAGESMASRMLPGN